MRAGSRISLKLFLAGAAGYMAGDEHAKRYHMDESCMYEGMRAVCAVLAEVEAGARERPALRLAERHLHLLAELAEQGLGRAPGTGGESAPAWAFAGASLGLPAREEAGHVLQ